MVEADVVRPELITLTVMPVAEVDGPAVEPSRAADPTANSEASEAVTRAVMPHVAAVVPLGVTVTTLAAAAGPSVVVKVTVAGLIDTASQPASEPLASVTVTSPVGLEPAKILSSSEPPTGTLTAGAARLLTTISASSSFSTARLTAVCEVVHRSDTSTLAPEPTPRAVAVTTSAAT